MNHDEPTEALDALAKVGDLIGGLSHDLNNPLAGILGYCHLLRAETDPERVREYAGHIREQAEVCRDMVATLQDCVGQPDVPLRSLVVRDVVDTFLMFGGGAAGCPIQTDIADDLVAWGESELLRRALSRLVENARAAAGPSGSICISGYREGDHTLVVVSDDGPGFPEHVRGRAFDPTVTSRRSGSGVGLGLPAAYTLARACGGAVRILAYGPGGTRVALELPTNPPVRAGGQPDQVLFVDDDTMVLELYMDVADSIGVPAIPARSVDAALRALGAGNVRCVVCDFNLADGSIERFYDAITARWPELAERFVVCTGSPEWSSVRTFADERGLSVLAKPFTVEELRALLTS